MILQGGRISHNILRSIVKENYRKLLYDNKVYCSSSFVHKRSIHVKRSVPQQQNTSLLTSKIPTSHLIVRQVTDATDQHPSRKIFEILKKILKVSLGTTIALLTTGGLLLAKTIYDNEDEPDSSENMKAPSNKSDINKEWVEFMLTKYENRQSPCAKVTVNTFEVGDATKTGDGFSGQHISLLVSATIQRDSSEEQSSQTYDKEYNLFVKMLKPHPFMMQMFKYNKMDFNEHLFYSDVMGDFQKFQTNKTNENVCPSIPNYIYGKVANTQFVLVMENMKHHGYGPHPKEKELNLHQVKLGIEQFARLHAVSYAYGKENNLLNKYPSYNQDAVKHLSTVGYGPLLDSCIEFLKGRKGNEELIKKISSTKSKLAEKAREVHSYDTNIKSLVHADCWSNNLLFKSEIDENGDETFVDSKDALVLDFQGLHWHSSILDVCMYINRNTTPEFRKKHLEELLIYYHSIFTDILTKLDYNEYCWTYEQFKSEYEKSLPWSLKFAFSGALVQTEILKKMRVGTSEPGPPGPFWTKIKHASAKLVAPLFLHPRTYEYMMSGVTGLFLKELIEDKNKKYCDLMFEILLEAEQNGLFDESRY